MRVIRRRCLGGGRAVTRAHVSPPTPLLRGILFIHLSYSLFFVVVVVWAYGCISFIYSSVVSLSLVNLCIFLSDGLLQSLPFLIFFFVCFTLYGLYQFSPLCSLWYSFIYLCSTCFALFFPLGFFRTRAFLIQNVSSLLILHLLCVFLS